MSLPWRKYYQAVRRYFIFKPKPYQGGRSDFGGCSGYLFYQDSFSPPLLFFFHLVSGPSHCWSRQLHHLFPMKEQFRLFFLLGIAYLHVNFIYSLFISQANSSSIPKGILLISGLRSVEVSSLKWLSTTWPRKFTVFSTEESFTRGKVKPERGKQQNSRTKFEEVQLRKQASSTHGFEGKRSCHTGVRLRCLKGFELTNCLSRYTSLNSSDS